MLSRLPSRLVLSRLTPNRVDNVAYFACAGQLSNQTSHSEEVKESRWQRLKRLRKAAPTPANRTKHQFDRSQSYELPLAISHVRSAQWAKFDESLELILRLNIDPRRADQNLRGTIALPHGTGRADRVLVFAEDEEADGAIAAGADLVGSDELIGRIKEEKGKPVRGFSVAVAVPHLVPIVAGEIGRLLGPKGLMPSEKTGTVGSNVSDIVRQVKRGWLSYRTDKDGNMHMNVAKVNFEDEKIIENVLTATRGILDVRPAAVKKRYLKKAFVCSSMGPSVLVDVEDLVKRVYSMTALA